MKKEHEHGSKTRILLIQRAILEQPYRYTIKQLADQFGVNPDTIRNGFRDLKNAGFSLRTDERHRYGFVIDKPLKQLKDLLHFSKEDQALLHLAIDQIAQHTERAANLKKKLASLYDYQRLGYAYLRKPHLTKLDLLLQGQKEKKVVILRDYSSSNSNIISDRFVEPFHVSPPEDTLQAFDVDKKILRHFRFSRIKRVQLTDTDWQFEGHHNIMRTDPFRIVDNEQVLVHLKLKIGAKNELEERFPLTKSYITEANEEDIYDFQCNVNHNFLGLTNFILGFYHQLVEVVYPEQLIIHLKNEVNNMKF
ncbi:MAG: WYL domain-containing protein [Saprospiraceae bacterium]|nr:WYL domain-containing protein [Saprospiraceae bacterium]MCB9322108.1 WYL domain-containing protein [Lewinellaceae bacterium]